MFKKKDLKDGDIVTYKNGWRRTFIGGKLISEEGVVSKTIDEYNGNLENLSFGGPSKENELNIVNVERPIKYEVFYENKEILDEAEKRYLRGVIRPFRDNVEIIGKLFSPTKGKYYIQIRYKNEPPTNLPYFESKEIYKNMETDKKYTLEELGL